MFFMEQIEKQSFMQENQLSKINSVLNCLDEKSLNLIKARYFERNSFNKLSENFNMLITFISVKNKKILNDMKIALDPVEN